jgi:hypothetical protein
VALKQTSLATIYDLDLGHKSFAPQSDVQPYTDMAERYVFGDNMFHAWQAGSFPGKQHLISASGEVLPARRAAFAKVR